MSRFNDQMAALRFQFRHKMLTKEQLNHHLVEAASQYLARFCPILNSASLVVTDLIDEAKKQGMYKHQLKYECKRLDKELERIIKVVMAFPGFDFSGQQGAAFLGFNDNVHDIVKSKLNTLYYTICNCLLYKFPDKRWNNEVLSRACVASLAVFTLTAVNKALHNNWQEQFHHPLVLPWEDQYDLAKVGNMINNIVGMLCSYTPLHVDTDDNVATAFNNFTAWITSTHVLDQCIRKASIGKPEFEAAITEFDEHGCGDST